MKVHDVTPSIRQVLELWSENLAAVLESMTGHRPDVHCSEISLPQDAASRSLWCEQAFQPFADWKAWVGAPSETWEYAGGTTLKAAGLDSVELTETRNTWLEILGQSLTAMARSIGSIVRRDVTCESMVEHPPDPDASEWVSVQLIFPGMDLPPLFAGLSAALVVALSSPPRTRESRDPEPVPAAAAPLPTLVGSRTMDLLLDVEMPVSISFGRARLPLKEVVKLTTGSIVELNRHTNEQVEVMINEHLIARGEVVVIEGNYGVRILEIASPQDRLRSIQ